MSNAYVGQELPFDDPGKQPIERLLYFGACRKANSHNSATADLGPVDELWQLFVD